MNRSTTPLILTLVVLLSATLGGWTAWRWWAPSDRTVFPAAFTMHQELMGTSWSVQVWSDHPSHSPGLEHALQACFDEVARVESVMSEWIPDSPVSRINLAAGGPPVKAPAELVELLQRACALSERSQGAFDVTWKGLGNLWKLRDPDFAPPSPQEINRALSCIDYRQIAFLGDKISLQKPDMVLGLGGIAKGYGLDRAAACLRDQGITNFFLNGGGDILVSGLKEDRPWRIGIRHPRRGPEDLLAVVELTHGAVATSGDYERYRDHKGKRYHHIIDPRNGRPADACQSVTVLAARAEMADALATAIFVLGPEKGLALAERESGVESMVVDAQGKIHCTPGFLRHARLFESADFAAQAANYENP